MIHTEHYYLNLTKNSHLPNFMGNAPNFEAKSNRS